VIRRGGAVALLGALLVLAGGCTTAPRPAPELAGRLSVSVDAHDGAPARSVSTQFELSGDARAGDLQLSTMLGTTAGQAHWRPGSAELTTGEGTRRFSDLDALALNLFGETLPLTAMIDWLRGKPWPGAPDTATADGFEQFGWRIDLSRFAQGWVLAARERAPAVSVRVKLDPLQ
jgi:outer membrane lipoprotein LolB